MRSATLSCVAVLTIILACGPSAWAKVTDSSPQGFVVEVEVPIQAPPQQVYRQLVENIGKWWESAHTYSGDAKNLYLEAAPKGWFGERLADGGAVQHMEVVFVAPNKLLRLRGALGPLQEFAITGSMTWSLTAKDETTTLKLTYNVGGYRPGGIADFAQPVDLVLTTQVERLKRFVETGNPKS